MADYDRFNLRFSTDPVDSELRQRLEEAAKKNERSLHQEIMARLRASFEQPPLESRLAALEHAVFKKGK